MNAAIVSGVLTGGKFTVLLDAGFWNLLGVLVSNALIALVVIGSIGGDPPVAQVAIGIELAALIIVAVGHFMPDDGADRAIVHGVNLFCLEERRLQYSGGEIDGVGLRILIGVDGRRSHTPFIANRRLAELGHSAIDL